MKQIVLLFFFFSQHPGWVSGLGPAPVGQRLSLNYSRGERVLAPFLFVFDHRI